MHRAAPRPYEPGMCLSWKYTVKLKGVGQDWFQRNILQHRKRLKQYLLGLTKSREDAEDLEQEAYLRVISSNDRHEIDNPRAFLFVTARNLAIQAWRRKKNSPIQAVEDFDALNVRDICASVDSEVLTDELLAAFGEAIDALPPQARRVFIRLMGVLDRSILDRSIDWELSTPSLRPRSHVHRYVRQSRQDAAPTEATEVA